MRFVDYGNVDAARRSPLLAAHVDVRRAQFVEFVIIIIIIILILIVAVVFVITTAGRRRRTGDGELDWTELRHVAYLRIVIGLV